MSQEKILFVTDFDGTMTKVDTSYLALRSCHRYIDGTEDDREILLNVWKQRAVDYTLGYQRAYENGLKNSAVEEQKNLIRLSESLDKYNKESRIDIAKTKLLDDFSTRNLQELVAQIQFYPHALETLSTIKESLAASHHCKILSVNWFKPLLVEALKDIVTDSKQIVTASVPFFKDDDSIDLGLVYTSVGKRDWMVKWCSEDEYNATIYIGDSLTDLLALLEVDYGIVFGNNLKVFEAAKYFGITMVPLSDVCSPKKAENCLYFTKDWHDIHRFVQLLKS